MRLGSESSIQVVHPGINPNKFLKIKKTKNPSFLYLGRLQEYKNIDVAIKAFAQVVKEFPEAMLTIAGFGEAQKSLKRLAAELGLEKQIHFVGKVSEEEKAELLASHWVFVQPSMLEGWGITVIEANASSTPVIASNVNGLKDSVSDMYSGFLINPKDVDGFAEAMLDLIKDKKLRNKLSKQALFWSKNFDWNVSADKFNEAIYQKLRERKFAYLGKVAVAKVNRY